LRWICELSAKSSTIKVNVCVCRTLIFPFKVVEFVQYDINYSYLYILSVN
jgi:hypothetical protein